MDTPRVDPWVAESTEHLRSSPSDAPTSVSTIPQLGIRSGCCTLTFTAVPSGSMKEAWKKRSRNPTREEGDAVRLIERP